MEKVRTREEREKPSTTDWKQKLKKNLITLGQKTCFHRSLFKETWASPKPRQNPVRTSLTDKARKLPRKSIPKPRPH